MPSTITRPTSRTTPAAHAASTRAPRPGGRVVVLDAPVDTDVVVLRGSSDAVRRGPAAAGRRRRGRARVLAPVVALVAVLVFVVSGLLAPSLEATQEHLESDGVVYLEPGMTLWDVAVAHRLPGEDPRVLLRAIEHLNEFDSAHLPAWTPVLIPRR